VNEESPKSLGRYEIQDEIGRGMMGVVYRALDPALSRTIALKVVRLAFSIPEDQRDVFEKRFLAEARAAAALAHPGIVVVHDVGRDPDTGTLFIALEFLEGRTLAELTSGNAAMPWREALRVTARIAEALDHAHSQGIVHRDVKPANIMLLPAGEPKIMDFGIAKIPASQLTSAGEFLGTPTYMSPEQAKGAALDGRSDLFSLGSVLFLLLTGRRAFDAPNVPAILSKVVSETPPAPSSLVEGLPKAVDDLVCRALAKDPADRYPTGRAFSEDIADILEGRPPRHSRVVQPMPRQEAAPRSARWGRRAVIALSILGVLSALFLLRKPSALAPLEQPAAVPPAHLEVGLEYSFRAGHLLVFVDDNQVLDEPLESHVVRKVFSLRFRKGLFKKTIDVAPGDHVVKVQLEADGETLSRKIHGTLQSGATRHLEINLGGILKKELEVGLWP
jgi:serine/threonine protein kinase